MRGLDMGSGTGVLAIVAALRGAEAVDAVDIDEWAYENCVENIRANGVETRVTPLLGDIGAIAGRRYDFIAANINRNICWRSCRLCRSARRRRLAAHERDSEADVAPLSEAARCGLLRYGRCAAQRLGTRGRREN